MKKIPKGQMSGMFAVEWKEQNFMIKTWSIKKNYYQTKELAQEAFEVAVTHKTKHEVSLKTAHPEPLLSSEDQGQLLKDGGRWDAWAGCYVYSASY